MASDFQYDSAAEPPAIGSATTMKTGPPPISRFRAKPTATTNRTKPAMRKMERRLFCATWSYTRGSGGCGGRGVATRVDRRRRAEVAVEPVALFARRLEAVPRRDAEPLGDCVGRECLDHGVDAVDGSVVERQRVGEQDLCAGQVP